MKQQSILFGIVGLVVGGLLTYTVTANTVNKTETATTPSSGTAMQHGGQSSSMMASLEGKTGEEFDKAFLSGMIVHHQDAVEMSKAAQTDAGKQEIKDLAEEIIKAQESEIQMMQQWQKDWGFTQ